MFSGASPLGACSNAEGYVIKSSVLSCSTLLYFIIFYYILRLLKNELLFKEKSCQVLYLFQKEVGRGFGIGHISVVLQQSNGYNASGCPQD